MNGKGGFWVRNKAGGRRHLSLDRTLEEAAANVSDGQYGQALLLLEKAVRLAPLNARVRCLLGESQAKTGNLNAAVANLQKAVEAAPKNAGYRSSLAHALMPEKPEAAVPHFLAAVELGSTSPEVFCNLASILLDLRREEEALKICDLGLKACPNEFGLLTNRAVALQLLGRFDEALACCYRQHELQPGLRRVWSNMGNIFMGLGRLAESEEAHRQACLCDPQNGDAHYSLALTLLLSGQHREGFREYEWRWQSKAMKDRRRNFAQPLWDGRFLGEKRILLHAEQGAGDTIQFARYLPLVAALGSRIVLEVPPHWPARELSSRPAQRRASRLAHRRFRGQLPVAESSSAVWDRPRFHSPASFLRHSRRHSGQLGVTRSERQTQGGFGLARESGARQQSESLFFLYVRSCR